MNSLDKPLESEIPLSSVGWHKVSRARVMVIGYANYLDGSVCLIVNDGSSGDIIILSDLITLSDPNIESPFQS